MIKKTPVKLLLLLGVVIAFSISKTRLENKDGLLFNNPYTAKIDYSEIEIPEGRVEIETDTILTNDFTVKTKFHSTNEKIVKIDKGVNSIKKTIYKDFHSDLFVYYKDKRVLKKQIKKELFAEPNNGFWQQSIMHSVVLNESASINNQVVFTVSFYNPSLNKFLDYELRVDQLGDYYTQNISV